MALSYFYSCYKFSEKYPKSNPDSNLAFQGMGYVFYKLREFEIALQCFLLVNYILSN